MSERIRDKGQGTKDKEVHIPFSFLLGYLLVIMQSSSEGSERWRLGRGTRENRDDDRHSIGGGAATSSG